MGKQIDLTRMSAHVTIDRADRVRHIENSIGWGTEIARAPDRNAEGVYRVLTSTGVIIVQGEDGFMITAWVASVNQAIDVWVKAKPGKKIWMWLWNVINYNNNTEYWRNKVAA
jgi:hypothetical protein